MNLITLHKTDAASLQETTSALSTRGITLSREDIKKLILSQERSCHHFSWVETDNGLLNRILLPFTSSPYMSLQNYCQLLENIVFLYYAVRSHFDWHVDDDTIMNALYIAYLSNHGIEDKKMYRTAVCLIKERGML